MHEARIILLLLFKSRGSVLYFFFFFFGIQHVKIFIQQNRLWSYENFVKFSKMQAVAAT